MYVLNTIVSRTAKQLTDDCSARVHPYDALHNLSAPDNLWLDHLELLVISKPLNKTLYTKFCKEGECLPPSIPAFGPMREGESWSCEVTGEERGLLVRPSGRGKEEELVLMEVRGGRVVGRVGRVERVGRVGRVGWSPNALDPGNVLPGVPGS